jgi:hypothetical protein
MSTQPKTWRPLSWVLCSASVALNSRRQAASQQDEQARVRTQNRLATAAALNLELFVDSRG